MRQTQSKTAPADHNPFFLKTFPAFLPPEAATRARKKFESIYKNPYQAKSERFIWDPWFIAGRYALLRSTPASVFGVSSARRIFKNLSHFGQNQFGLPAISEPWVSLYLEGHHQNFHTDANHGPLAFVLSLGPGLPQGSGVTEILNPKRAQNSQEHDHLFSQVPPQFNQLVVFDPKHPHRVTPVRSVLDPLQGRLVIHGWFTRPSLQVHGALAHDFSKTTPDWFPPWLDAVQDGVESVLKPTVPLRGFLNVHFDIAPSGKVTQSTILLNTLDQHLPLKPWIGQVPNLPQRRSSSRLIVPLEWI